MSGSLFSKTERQRRYMQYREGWTRGAQAGPSVNIDESEAYDQGYAHGYKARKTALSEACKAIGYWPSPLRAETSTALPVEEARRLGKV